MSVKLPEHLLSDITRYLEQYYICPPEEKPKRYSRAERCESRAIMEDLFPCAPQAASLEDMLRQEDAGFTETLLKLIDKTGRKDSEIYKKANLSRQHFFKIRNDLQYKPTKATAIALALALELDIEETKDLIGRAGYALSNSSKFDLIVRFFVENRNYNVQEINLALYEFDQPLLGA